MCGIVGVLNTHTNQTPDRATVRRMRDRISYRGPDQAGEHADGAVAFGFRRLSIIDLATGSQPILSADGRYAIIFNGEIYNYRKLRPDLEKKYRFRTQSDTEVLLYHLVEHGPARLGDLNGMFAFALWDKQKQELLLARDRFGKKPLYYSYDGKTFVFASEIKSLLAYPTVSRDLDRTALARYFLYEFIPAPDTPFQHIKKVPAGEYLTISTQQKQVEIKSWWKLENLLQTSKSSRTDSGDLVRGTGILNFSPAKRDESRILIRSQNLVRLDELLEEAVRSRMVADVPVGVLLSGGIDSSTIAYYMRRRTDHLHSFSVSFPEASFDESRYARLAARTLGTTHHDIRFDLPAFHRTLDVIRDHLDEPLGDASLLPTFLVSQAAKEHVTVTLDGDGADELLAGYDTFLADSLARRFGPLLKPALQMAAAIFPTNYKNFSLDFKIKSFLRGLNYAGLTRNQVWLGSFHDGELSELLTPEWQVSPDQLFTPVRGIEARFPSQTPLQQLSAAYLAHYLQDDILAKLDRASMYASLESRTPFLDPALASFLFQLPDHEKLHSGQSKIILKKLMRGRLPKEIINRPKKGFGIPLGLWLRGPLKNLLHESLSRQLVESTGICNYSTIRELIDQHLSGRADHRKKLWTLMIFHWWHQKWAA